MSNSSRTDLERAATQARRVIHDNDVERLKQLLAQYPALLSWRGHDPSPLAWPDGTVLAMATGAYGDSFDPDRERSLTRAACAELLIDAGALVTPAVCDGIVESRARGLLELFRRKGVLPHTLKFLAALGDLDAVRAALDENGKDPAAINEALFCACAFEHEAIASLLLERLIALDAELGQHVEASGGPIAFIRFLSENPSHDSAQATTAGPWQISLKLRVRRAVNDGDLTAFISGLQRDPSLLGDAGVRLQAELIGQATLNGRGEFLQTLWWRASMS